MTARNLLLAVLLVLATAAHATTVQFEPSQPTTKTDVILTVTESDSCPPAPVVTRDGFTIHVALGAGICLSPPATLVHHLNLGHLPAGTYTVLVTDENEGEPPSSTSFEVLDADADVIVTPSFGNRGSKVQIYADLPCPGHTICPVPDVFFGGVQAFDVDREGNHWVTLAPNHAPGVVEVRVTNGQSTKSAFAFRYIDPNEPPFASLYEKVLIPIIYNGPGGFGSNWKTEVTVRSDNAYDVVPWRPLLTAGNFPAGSPIVVSAGTRPDGLFFYVPRESAGQMHYNVLVRDTNREDDDWGTQIPVVRESELTAGPKELLNAPLDPRYRLTLRIYADSPAPGLAKVTMYTMTLSGAPIYEREVPLTSVEPCGSAPCTSDHPAMAVIGDLPTDFPGLSRVGIRIDGLGRAVWGFLTVTNNATQHVTVISPE